MGILKDCGDPVRDAIAHAEAAPPAFASWPLPELLRRLRIRFRMNRKQLAAKAGVSASLIGRAEKGADNEKKVNENAISASAPEVK